MKLNLTELSILQITINGKVKVVESLRNNKFSELLMNKTKLLVTMVHLQGLRE